MDLLSRRRPYGRARFPSKKARAKQCWDKRRYASGEVAEREGKRLGLNFYWCRHCKGWHLTRSG